MPHIYITTEVEYACTTYAPGVHEVSVGRAHALSQRVPVRPATQIEIEKAAHPQPETASAKPEAEQATSRRKRVTRKAAS